MKLVALMPARNEDWIIGLSARVALMWCDALVVLDHASHDGTVALIGELVNQHPGRVLYLHRDDPKWDEMADRQRMLEAARGIGATHIAIVDADEVLTANLVPTIREHVSRLDRQDVLQLPGYNLRGVGQYHTNGVWGRRWFSIVFRDDERLHWAGDQFHHREPFGRYLEPWQPVPQSAGGILHFWGASERRLRAKHALYKITERLRWPEKPISQIESQYNLAIAAQDSWTFAELHPNWWSEEYTALASRYSRAHAEPWQVEECRRLIREHGIECFEGLNLFGVDYPDATHKRAAKQ